MLTRTLFRASRRLFRPVLQHNLRNNGVWVASSHNATVQANIRLAPIHEANCEKICQALTGLAQISGWELAQISGWEGDTLPEITMLMAENTVQPSAKEEMDQLDNPIFTEWFSDETSIEPWILDYACLDRFGKEELTEYIYCEMVEFVNHLHVFKANEPANQLRYFTEPAALTGPIQWVQAWDRIWKSWKIPYIILSPVAWYIHAFYIFFETNAGICAQGLELWPIPIFAGGIVFSPFLLTRALNFAKERQIKAMADDIVTTINALAEYTPQTCAKAREFAIEYVEGLDEQRSRFTKSTATSPSSAAVASSEARRQSRRETPT